MQCWWHVWHPLKSALARRQPHQPAAHLLSCSTTSRTAASLLASWNLVSSLPCEAGAQDRTYIRGRCDMRPSMQPERLPTWCEAHGPGGALSAAAPAARLQRHKRRPFSPLTGNPTAAGPRNQCAAKCLSTKTPAGYAQPHTGCPKARREGYSCGGVRWFLWKEVQNQTPLQSRSQ